MAAGRNWKINLQDPNVWNRRIEVARRVRSIRERELRWQDAYQAYQGKILADTPTNDTVVVNFPQAYISNMLPSVYFTQPRIQVRPTQEAFREAAKLMEPTVNFAIRRMRMARQARRSIQDMLLIGHGWFKLGWATKYGEIPGPEQGVQNEPLSAVDKLADRQIYFRPGHAFGKRVHPFMMLADPTADCWEEVRWVDHMTYRPYHWLMEDPFIKHQERIYPGHTMDTETGVYRPKTEAEKRDQDDQGFVLTHEIWDLDSRRVRLLADGSDAWQRDEAWPYEFMPGLPFYLLQASDPVDDIYPQSPLMSWYAQVQELSKIRTMQLDTLYRARGKTIVAKGAMDDDEIEKMKNPLEDVLIAREPEKITSLRLPTIDPNLYICEDRVKRDILDISGLSELQYGNIPGGRVTATVGMIAQKASAIRTRRIIDAIKEWMLDIGRDLSLMLANRLPEEQQVAITTDTGQEWLTVSRADIEGEFLFDMDVTEMAPLSREARQKEALDILASVGQTPVAKLRRVVADVLEAYGRTEIDAYLNPDMGPPADPQYENELMIQGIEVLPNPAEDFELHLRVHADFMEGDLFQSVVGEVPAIRNLFAAHIQRTIALANQVMAAQGGNGGAPRSVGQSAQQGRPLATSQPAASSQTTGGG